MRIDNLRDSQAVRTRKQVKALGTRAPIGDSSITTPGKRLRVGAPGGGGYLQAGGALVWQGPVNFTGPFSNTGTFTNNGQTYLNGPTDITGLVTLLSNLLVQGGGKITINGGITMTLENGEITFANGGKVRGNADAVVVDAGGPAQVRVTSAATTIVAGTSSLATTGTGTIVNGVTDFKSNVLLNDQLFANGLQSAPLAGVPSGCLVRSPTTGQVYVAI